MKRLSDLLGPAEKGRAAILAGLSAPAFSLLTAYSFPLKDLVVVTPDLASARNFADDLRLFSDGAHVRLLLPSVSAPYERLLPDVETSASRMAALAALHKGQGPVVIPSISLMQAVPPPNRLSEWVLDIRPGQALDRDGVIRRLAAMGYRRQPVVSEVGDMAVRGGILDIFSPLQAKPARVELWDDSVQSLRFFDPDSQRSIEPADRFLALPVTEILLDTEERPAARARLVSFLVSAGLPAREREMMLAAWDDGAALPGMADLLPVIYGGCSYPGDFFRPDSALVLHESTEIASFLRVFADSARSRSLPGYPPPQDLYADPDRLGAFLLKRASCATSLFGAAGSRTVECSPPLPASFPSSRPDRLTELARMLGEEDHGRQILVLRSRAAVDRLTEILSGLGITLPCLASFSEALAGPSRCMVTGTLSAGFALPEAGLTVISDTDIFGPSRERRAGRLGAPDWELPIGSLVPGDIVVHVDHGIGRYEGLRQMEVAGWRGDFLQLSYEGGDSLYVPVDQMNRVQRYRSASETPPPLSRLGGTAWKRSKARIRRSLKLMAGELLLLSAARRTKPGHAFPAPDALFKEFEASFPWVETPDQERTIAEVLHDMTQPQAMDRLVCGDVGYGKTEVALRAAFLAAVGGKQTAVLVPTTVLAQQHYQNFAERLADFPVKVGLLSRFVPPAEQERTLADLASGALDIVVGTHRLLSVDVAFANLGLLVIDEEHRFGVRHKEKLKKVRETVDVLTLSATPIPRTLFQAFSGLRSLSLIHTPPVDRKAIHTEVRYFEEDLIRDAIVREMERGGQVFIVHNRIASIKAFARMVEKLVPEARIGVAHGQMEERHLEEVMVAFISRELDVLVSTAIIESGLDITNANTLIVNRADRFGLAQLYQLRGRVGRSSVLAYAYLLIPPEASLSADARQRLSQLRDLTELGSGFKLASYDLEMRGAGNLLGAEQSGRIDAVGLDLFSQLLEQSIREAAGQAAEPEVEPAVTLPLAAYLSEDYLPEVGERLTLYKRLASAQTLDEVETLREEVADRFGRFPPEVKGLFERMRVHVMARRLSIERIDTAGSDFLVVFHPQARVSPDALVGLLSSDNRARFIPPVTLRLIASSMRSSHDRVLYLMDTLKALGA